MTWLFFVNFFFFQWMCLRLAKVIEGKTILYYTFIVWILPLTGWWSNFIYLSKKKTVGEFFRK